MKRVREAFTDIQAAHSAAEDIELQSLALAMLKEIEEEPEIRDTPSTTGTTSAASFANTAAAAAASAQQKQRRTPSGGRNSFRE
jgi:hypothetical protein